DGKVRKEQVSFAHVRIRVPKLVTDDLTLKTLVQLLLYFLKGRIVLKLRNRMSYYLVSLQVSIVKERAIGDQVAIIAIDDDDHLFQAFNDFLVFSQLLIAIFP